MLVISWAYLILGLQQWCLLVCKQRDGAMDSVGMAGEMTHTRTLCTPSYLVTVFGGNRVFTPWYRADLTLSGPQPPLFQLLTSAVHQLGNPSPRGVTTRIQPLSLVSRLPTAARQASDNQLLGVPAVSVVFL